MKRDMDLIRSLLLTIEALPPREVEAESFRFEGVDRATIREHVRLLIEQGLVEGEVSQQSVSMLPGGTWARIRRITWAGHEYLDSVRNEKAWSKIKEAARDRGVSLTFEVTKLLAIEYVKSRLGGPKPQ